ncbi:HemK2/MTQ2 family protein methyltransferase [Actinacidiphila yeochonensis]|uniref:HemK2/MTQ2 family protein methyltransferase n=1 Tax=Actinacidiphila yeochonensis TaxID=89050 RepID=UPI00056A9F10|nr:HemK2/MTQ2 family protein methyltransferase [Actinacidiphila yeochonensis]
MPLLVGGTTRPSVTLPGVYPPQEDTRLLIGAIRREPIGAGSEVLDLGTGSGALAVCAARLGARVTAVDVSHRAVLCARLNAVLSRQRVAVRRRDLAAAGPAGRYDLVVSNPPYLPGPLPAPGRHGRARAWDGGPDGRALVDRACRSAATALRPGGVLLMVHSGMCGARATLARLAEAGMRGGVVDSRRVPFGPVVRDRLPWLRDRGLVGNGQQTEELVVIRAEQR